MSLSNCKKNKAPLEIAALEPCACYPGAVLEDLVNKQKNPLAEQFPEAWLGTFLGMRRPSRLGSLF